MTQVSPVDPNLVSERTLSQFFTLIFFVKSTGLRKGNSITKSIYLQDSMAKLSGEDPKVRSIEDDVNEPEDVVSEEIL
jgi:hypothetical protein